MSSNKSLEMQVKKTIVYKNIFYKYCLLDIFERSCTSCDPVKAEQGADSPIYLFAWQGDQSIWFYLLCRSYYPSANWRRYV